MDNEKKRKSETIENEEKKKQKLTKNKYEREHNLPLTVEIQKKGIHHQAMWYYTTEEDSNKKTISQYPNNSDKLCTYCSQKITGVPILIPNEYDEKRNIWILNIFHYCCKEHAKLAIVQTNKFNINQECALFGKFCRDVLNTSEEISCLPLSVMKEYSDYGIYTRNEYNNIYSQYYGTILNLPSMMLPTFLEIKKKDIEKIENEKKERRKQKILENFKVTEAQ